MDIDEFTEKTEVQQEIYDASRTEEDAHSEIKILQSASLSDPSTYCSTFSLGFFDLALEIRHLIYNGLFSIAIPISFQTGFWDLEPPLGIKKNYGLSPAFLRVNQQVHCEARSFLYSNNQFDLSSINHTYQIPTNDAALAYFLGKIGNDNGSLLRHIQIDFPASDRGTYKIPGGVWEAMEEFVGTVKQIKDKCSQIKTVEMVLTRNIVTKQRGTRRIKTFHDESKTIDWINEQLHAIPSLKVVIFKAKCPEGNEIWD
ncbi:90df51e3-c848-4e40-a3ee-4272611cbbd9 [Sclerotinia trifoliorum]|uniref:90df51e3-c848-4e40-a3ee-4272611cbbd9 n=1 Tax=Sclerotinia trifoliorum TaxID=28548 RepID=A0A8H2VMI7_9HELO|nr:90df51e3-c848-4e40-a3ee-4272611cbbd9 [Sclerotinia trifoliorum]